MVKSSFNSESMRYHNEMAKANSSRVAREVEDLDVPVGEFVLHRGCWLIRCEELPSDRKVKIQRSRDGQWMLVRLATGPIVDNLYSFSRIFL